MWIWILQFIRTDFISKTKTPYEENVKTTDYNYQVEVRCRIWILWETLKFKGVFDVEEGGGGNFQQKKILGKKGMTKIKELAIARRNENVTLAFF